MFTCIFLIVFGLELVKAISRRVERSRQKRYDDLIRQRKELARIEQQETKAAERKERELARESEKQAKAEERAAKDEKKRQDAAEKLAIDKNIASSQLEYIRHRIEQLENLTDYYTDKQEGCIANGKEYFKLEQSIMRCEKELAALAQKQIKLRAILNKTI